MLHQFVGKPFPDERYLSLEGTAVSFTASSFDIICVLADLDEDEINRWQQQPFKYGIFNEGAIPFFVSDFGNGLVLSCPFNVREVKAKLLINWLMLPDTYINLFLVEKKGYILKASRVVALDPLLMRSLKSILRNQYSRYNSEKEILARISALQKKCSTEEMYLKTSIHTAC